MNNHRFPQKQYSIQDRSPVPLHQASLRLWHGSLSYFRYFKPLPL